MTIFKSKIVMMGFESEKRVKSSFGNRHRYKGNDLKSDAELRFALLLDRLIELKQVASWKYEPEDFWFDDIRRGTVSYKPDFFVFWLNGDSVYYEIKDGKITSKDITKWKRVTKRNENMKLVLVWPAEPNPRKRNGKANRKWQLIEDGKKYVDHVWYVNADYRKLGIPKCVKGYE